MFDPISQSLAAVGSRSPYAAPLVFVAGVASSVGPCVAPRFIAVASLSTGKSGSQTRALASAFITGLTLAYAAFGATAALLMRATQLSTYTYAAVALALAAGGFITLYRERGDCAHRHARQQNASLGGALLLGASFALVISPCCAPLLLGILAYTSSEGSPAYASALLASFALGHALPLAGAAFGANGVASVLARAGVRHGAGVISGALMLALAGYYAVLA